MHVISKTLIFTSEKSVQKFVGEILRSLSQTQYKTVLNGHWTAKEMVENS